MKRAFTLVEMLIVVALIATLMTIVLRLGSVGSDEEARNTTVLLLAKLENCLSGYYAAYGSYPPVPLCNSRDIYEGVNEYGVQNLDNSSNQALNDSQLWGWDMKKFQNWVNDGCSSSSKWNQSDENDAWNQVKAACESQPVALETPDPDIPGLSEGLKELQQYMSGQGGNWGQSFGTIHENIAGVDDDRIWRQSQIFKFGLLSFLLPRYQAMMGWPDSGMFNGDGGCRFKQWNDSNGIAPHDPLEGFVDTWREINKKAQKVNGYGTSATDNSAREARAYLEAIPSEAVTARWMPNLAGACCCDYPNRTFFGVAINDSRFNGLVTTDTSKLTPLCVYSPDGRQRYHLNRMTILDGWKTDFFYYSPSPHQAYRLWSAGKNKRTFPPWISRESLSAKAAERVTVWTEDDIGGMSN